MSKNVSARRIAFTLIELLVVVAIIALLISILLPSLARAREQTKSVKCLSNLRCFGQGIVTYTAQERDFCPGGLHPALYRNIGLQDLMEKKGYSYDDARRWQNRFLTGRLRQVMNDSSGRQDSVTEQLGTCPTMLTVVPDANFTQGREPTHYCINNYGTKDDIGAVEGGGGPIGNPRATKPQSYFGYSSPQLVPNDAELAKERKFPPQPITRIKNASQEWAVADAWWRERGGMEEFQQEGTFQSAWTGEYIPFFAPHFSRYKSFQFTNTNERRTEVTMIRSKKADDGRTNTVFFDGHAEPVKSKTFKAGPQGTELMYGFPGTKNPLQRKPPENSPLWGGYWS